MQPSSIKFTYKGYVGRAYWDSDSQNYRGFVDVLDAITFSGGTREDAKIQFVASVKGYLQRCAERCESNEAKETS